MSRSRITKDDPEPIQSLRIISSPNIRQFKLPNVKTLSVLCPMKKCKGGQHKSTAIVKHFCFSALLLDPRKKSQACNFVLTSSYLHFIFIVEQRFCDINVKKQ